MYPQRSTGEHHVLWRFVSALCQEILEHVDAAITNINVQKRILSLCDLVAAVPRVTKKERGRQSRQTSFRPFTPRRQQAQGFPQGSLGVTRRRSVQFPPSPSPSLRTFYCHSNAQTAVRPHRTLTKVSEGLAAGPGCSSGPVVSSRQCRALARARHAPRM